MARGQPIFKILAAPSGGVVGGVVGGQAVTRGSATKTKIRKIPAINPVIFLFITKSSY
jgi:hypothetical protein